MEPKNYAVVITATGVVDNVILWDGVTPYNPGDAYTLVQSDVANRGDTYDGTNFIPLQPAQ